MGIYYYKLFDLLNRRGLKKIDLKKMTGMSSATVSKLASNRVVQTDVLDRVCTALHCQPGDIMEWIEDKESASNSAPDEKTL